MRFSQSLIGNYEEAFASFYLCYNEWYSVDWATNGQNSNVRGMAAMLYLDPADIPTSITTTGSYAKGTRVMDPTGAIAGRAVWISGATGPVANKHCACVGVIEDSLECNGKIAPSGLWVSVQTYGYHDSLALRSNHDATGEILFATETKCLLDSMSRAMATSIPVLSGIINIDTTVNPAIIDLSAGQTLNHINDSDIDNAPAGVWAAGGDMALDFVNDWAKHTHATGTGTLTQLVANFAYAMRPLDILYSIVYRVREVVGTPTMQLSGIALVPLALPTTLGVHRVEIPATANPIANFVITVSSGAGESIILDDIIVTGPQNEPHGWASFPGIARSARIDSNGDRIDYSPMATNGRTTPPGAASQILGYRFLETPAVDRINSNIYRSRGFLNNIGTNVGRTI